MSIAELPIPSTTTCLPAKIELSTVGVRVQLHARERVAPGNAGSGQRGSQWWPLATISAS